MITKQERLNYRLHRAIKEAGLTQRAVAETAGIDPPTLSKIMRKRVNPNLTEMTAIARALQLPVSELWPDA